MEDRLIKFAHIVDAGSFTKAAAIMRISQPALTTAVKKLERELRAKLLLRENHTLTITPAGQIAYEAAQTLISQTQNLHVRIQEALSQEAAMSIGMIDSIADLLFVHGEYLQELEQSSRLSLSIDNSARLVRDVEQSGIDLALIAQPERMPATLKADKVAEEPLVIVTHRDNIVQVAKQLKQNVLPGFFSYNQASRTAHMVAGYFRKQGIELHPSFFSTSPELMLQLLLAKRGVAVLPYLLVHPHIQNGTLSPVFIHNSCLIMRTIISVKRPERILPAAAASLVAHTQHLLADQEAAAKQLAVNLHS